MPVIPLPCDGGGGPPPPPPPEPCCSPALATTPLCLTDGTPILLLLTSPCTTCGTAAADPVTGWIDPATGAYTPGAPAGAGPCPSADCASVTTTRLCDHTPDGGCAPFLRHLVHDCDGAVTATTDTTTDGTTPYTVAGEVIECGDCPCQDGTKVVPLCDYTAPGTEPVTFLRHLTYDCVTGQVIAEHDTATDGATPYTPVGEVAECGQCRPAPMCPQLLGLTGPETWVMPQGTESVSLVIACGPVTVTDCAGNATRINECGTTFSWGAPATGGCEPAALCSPFSLDLPEGAAAYITYISPCGTGDES